MEIELSLQWEMRGIIKKVMDPLPLNQMKELCGSLQMEVS